ncbi:hypothetical protein EYF80_055789 [Liparis tanakae]|uniref:Uncharacterized protein n=1 Tax=Liparis tanakae TaxID=230148 RepID=A0A4Z2EYI9_9TELE|nr:hypothetical protein EYF80_055789 [Liparis tanakae]
MTDGRASAGASELQGDHLALEVQHLVLAAAQRDAHHLVRDLHVAVEEASEGDDGPALLVLDAHVSDDPHHLLHLPVDVFLGAVAPLRRLGAVFGPAVAVVALAEALGHGEVVVEVLAEGVEPLARHVLHGPLLPAPLHVAARGDLNLGGKTEISLFTRSSRTHNDSCSDPAGPWPIY